MSGFLGKVALTDAGLQEGGALVYLLVGAGMVTSLLTLYAVAKAWSLAFWRTPEQAHEMALDLSDPTGAGAGIDGAAGRRPARTRHGDRDVLTFEAEGRDEARRVVDLDEDDEKDLYQLMQEDALPTRMPRTMVGATGALVAVSLALTLVAGPLLGYATRAATDLADQRVYVDAVLGEAQ